ncbi:pilus assembly PilX N-terminal domain-containing protein [Caloramator sp. mosi_1]|uniref:pilus assembly PilX N-terminal domain-containing protein n=1 Tax=Caloramator sp. mosi_1 TaxID=3023090 RepID=UPI002361328E|nr:pilus assembly PilX N-terminal domain-containing protein [Caloramator sp. mosi_1]WDC83231.1 pilus assembly PilX N-terminal domain-containing protein [Caloramator sp. mosi_1]
MKKKKGSALIFVILIIAVLFTLSIGVMQITLASLRQSTSYYGKNEAFYIADSSMEKILFYLDKVADEARYEANAYCFDASGAVNMQNFEEEYKKLLDGQLTKEEYEKIIKDEFIRIYKEYIIDF